MTSNPIKHHDAADVLAVSETGWRLCRKDQKQRAVWFLFQVHSPDGAVFHGAFDGQRWGSARDLAYLRRSDPDVFTWLAVTLRKLWDDGAR
jgi:hypothetical protein